MHPTLIGQRSLLRLSLLAAICLSLFAFGSSLAGPAAQQAESIGLYPGALSSSDPTFRRPNAFAFGESCTPAGTPGFGDSAYYDAYEFQSAGGPVLASLNNFGGGGSFDSYLVIYQASDGARVQPFIPGACTLALLASDDSYGNVRSEVASSVVAGYYYVVVTSFANNVTGNYTLALVDGFGNPTTVSGSLQVGDPTFRRTEPFGPGGTCSAPIGGIGDGAFRDVYELQASSPQPVLASFANFGGSASFISYLSIYQASGGVQIDPLTITGCTNALATNTNNYDDPRAEIAANVAAGYYYIVVSIYQRDQTGNYTLSYLTSVPASTPTATVAASSTVSSTATLAASPTVSSTATVVASPTATPCTISFTDVPTGYLFYADIQFLACRGVINGLPNGDGRFRFEPNANTTRAQFAKIAVNGFGIPPFTPAIPTFVDVPPGSTFYTFIESAANAGVITGLNPEQCAALGTPGRCYGPNLPISRAQVAVIVERIRNYAPASPTTPTFADVPANYFAYSAIETLVSRNIIGGAVCSGGVGQCFRPNDSIRRGELSKVVRRAIESLP